MVLDQVIRLAAFDALRHLKGRTTEVLPDDDIIIENKFCQIK
jgi:hypothetical protein